MAADARPGRASAPELPEGLTATTIRVLWAPNVVREVWRIHDYVATFSPRAAAHLAERLFQAGETLSLHPDRGRPVPGTPWRELVIVYPYIIRYQVTGDVARILRIRHGMTLR